MPHSLKSLRHQTDRLSQPKEIVPQRNRLLLSQPREKLPFQRWWRQHCSVNVKKRRNLFVASPCSVYSVHASSRIIFFLPRTATPAARYFHPSTKTGNPRKKQNPAVAQVKTIAPVRIAACASAVNSPSSATGPRVSASSNPK